MLRTDAVRSSVAFFIHSSSSSFFFFLSLSLGRNKDNLVGLGTGGLQRNCRGPTWGLRRAYGGPTSSEG